MSDENEEKLKKIVLEDCNMRIQTIRNARASFLNFFITINLAYIGALYSLITQKRDNSYIVILSLIVFLVDFSLFVMYVREHNAEKGQREQVTKIFRSFYPGFDDKDKYPSWYKFHDGFQDKFKGVTYFVISLLLIFFMIIPIVIIFHTWNIISAWLIIFLMIVFLCFSHFYKNIEYTDCCNFIKKIAMLSIVKCMRKFTHNYLVKIIFSWIYIVVIYFLYFYYKDILMMIKQP